MEHKPKDRIDDFFKQAFEGAEANPKEEEWNVPSDEVWEQIEAATQSDKKRRPLLLYWKWGAVAASLLLFMVVGAQAIQQQIKLNQQASKIKHIEKQLHDLQKKDSETTTTLDTTVENKVHAPISETSTQDSGFKKERNSRANERLVQSTIPSKTQPTENAETRRETTNLSGQEVVLVQESKNELVAIDSHLLAKETTLGTKRLEENTLQKSPIATLNLLEATDLDLLQQRPFAPLMKERQAAQINKQRPSLTAFFTPVQSAQRFEKKRRNFFKSDVLSENALNVGLQVAYPLTKGLYVETGVSYFKSSAIREHRPSTRFRRNKERLNNNGELESTYNITLLTSESVIETDIVLARASTSIDPDDGTELDLVLTSKTQIKQLQIPLLLGYRIQQKRLGLDIKMGLLATSALENTVGLERVQLNGQNLRIEEVKATQSRHFHKKNQIKTQLYLATALSYQVAENWAVQVEPYLSKATKQRALPQAFMNNTSIFAQSAGVKVGVRYTL